MDYTAIPAAFDSYDDRELLASTWDDVPAHLRGGLARYFEDGIIPGSFLQAVLENNFQQVMACAAYGISRLDLTNLALLLSCAPFGSWGSREAVKQYAEARR